MITVPPQRHALSRLALQPPDADISAPSQVRHDSSDRFVAMDMHSSLRTRFQERIVGTGHGYTFDVSILAVPRGARRRGLRTPHIRNDHACDRHMLLASIESRIALFTRVDAAAFVDNGNVAALFGDLDLRKQSYGVGLRLHTHRQRPRAWTLTRLATVVPFVP